MTVPICNTTCGETPATASAAAAAAAAGLLGQYAGYVLSGTVPTNTKFTLTEDVDVGGFALANNEIQVPANGDYEVVLNLASLTSTDVANPKTLTIELLVGLFAVGFTRVTRFSGTAGDEVGVSLSRIVTITDAPNEKISIKNASGTGNVTATGYLFLRRLS